MVSNKVEYSGIFGEDEGISVRYTVYQNRVEEDIFIERKTDIASFSMSVECGDLRAVLNEDNSVDFLDVSGERSGTAISYDIRSSLPTGEIATFVEDRMMHRLSAIDGVEWVNLSGVTPYEWVIEFDPEMSGLYGITADDIAAAFRTCFSGNIRKLRR